MTQYIHRGTLYAPTTRFDQEMAMLSRNDKEALANNCGFTLQHLYRKIKARTFDRRSAVGLAAQLDTPFDYLFKEIER